MCADFETGWSCLRFIWWQKTRGMFTKLKKINWKISQCLNWLNILWLTCNVVFVGQAVSNTENNGIAGTTFVARSGVVCVFSRYIFDRTSIEYETVFGFRQWKTRGNRKLIFKSKIVRKLFSNLTITYPATIILLLNSGCFFALVLCKKDSICM